MSWNDDKDENVSLRQAYYMMISFLEEEWIQGGKSEESLASLLGVMDFDLNQPKSQPLDQAMWERWRNIYHGKIKT